MRNFPKNWFSYSAGIILLIAGLAKIISGLGHDKYLDGIDPLFGLKFRYLMLLAAGVELLVALTCFSSKNRLLSAVLLAWLSSSFLFYRFGLSWVDWKKPCHCLGSLTDAIHLSQGTADTIMKALLAYLLIGSYALILCHWRIGRRDRPAIQ